MLTFYEEVLWTHLLSEPVRIILTDIAVVAPPVSDGEQKDLGVPEKRLKTAQLATDESMQVLTSVFEMCLPLKYRVLMANYQNSNNPSREKIIARQDVVLGSD